MDTRRRNELLGAVVGATVGAAAGSIVSSSPVVIVIGAAVGVLLGYQVEQQLNRRADTTALKHRIQELESETANLKTARKLLEHELTVAKATARISDIAVEVWGGAYNELAAKHPQEALPVSAILARLEVKQKAEGLDKPIAPPDLDS